jgi:hypothetical protein
MVKNNDVDDPKPVEGPPKPQVQIFEMIRHNDDSGISGTGVVAEGCVFSTGKTIVQWLGATPCIHAWDSFAAFKKIHIDSHPDNNTELVWYGRRKK